MTPRHPGLRRGAALIALALTLTLTACGARDPEDGGQPDPDQPTTVEYQEGLIGEDPGGDPVDGGTFTFAAFGEPLALDPAVAIAAGTTGGIEMTAVYDTLMMWDTEAEEFAPRLAESLEANDDSTGWTLTLREGVTFSDGTPFTAEAVVASQQRYVENQGPESTLWSDSVAEAEAIDERTVEYTLNHSWPNFPAILSTGPGMIVAPTVDDGDEFTPIGAGPFTLGSWKPQEELLLTAREDYWGGTPHLAAFRVVFLPDQNARVDALKNGSIDAAILRSPDLVDEALAEGKRGYNSMTAVSDMALINASPGRPGEDVRVRRAMALAIDPQVLKDRAFKGHGLASTTMFPEYSRWATEAQGPEYDPEEAKRLLEEAMADGYDGKISYLELAQPERRALALAVEAQLEAVGFDVEVELVRTSPDQIQRAINMDYDVSGFGLAYREADPYSKMYATMHSAGTQLFGMYTSPEMDELITEGQAAVDLEEGKAVMERIQQKVTEDVPYLNYGPIAEFIAWNDNVHGVNGSTNSLLLLDKAWTE